jgi:hypothetical protein
MRKKDRSFGSQDRVAPFLPLETQGPPSPDPFRLKPSPPSPERAEEFGWFRLPNHFMTPGEQAIVGMINVEAQLCVDSRKRLRYTL